MSADTAGFLTAIDSALADCTVSGDAMRWNPDAGRVICDGGGTLWPRREAASGWPSSWVDTDPATFRDCVGQWSMAGGGMAEIRAASQEVTREENLVRVRVTVDPHAMPRAGYCKVLLAEPISLEAGMLVLLETDGIPGQPPPPPAPGTVSVYADTSWRVDQDSTMTSLWCG